MYTDLWKENQMAQNISELLKWYWNGKTREQLSLSTQKRNLRLKLGSCSFTLAKKCVRER